MRLLTASHLGLAAACAYWLRDDAPPPLPEEPSADRDHGTHVHAAVACALLAQPWIPPANLTDIAIDRVRREAGHAQRWVDEQGYELHWPEVGYRANPGRGTARVASGRGPKGYVDVQEGEIPVTVDLVATSPGAPALVLELKTGRPPPAHASEVRTAALAVARAGGMSEVTAVLLYADEEGARGEAEALDAFALADHEADLRALIAGLSARPDPTPGPHCIALYCSARHACPATSAALARVEPTVPIPAGYEIADDDQARAIHRALPLAEARIEGLRAALRSYVRASPLTITEEGGEEVVYGWRSHASRRVRRLTGERTEAVARVLGARGQAALTTEVSTTVGALETAAGEMVRDRKNAGERVKIGKEVERLMGELAAAGVVDVSEHERCEVFRRTR
jgi:hypothetical protein